MCYLYIWKQRFPDKFTNVPIAALTYVESKLKNRMDDIVTMNKISEQISELSIMNDERMARTMNKEAARNSNGEYPEPPDNFREIPIYPQDKVELIEFYVTFRIYPNLHF